LSTKLIPYLIKDLSFSFFFHMREMKVYVFDICMELIRDFQWA